MRVTLPKNITWICENMRNWAILGLSIKEFIEGLKKSEKMSLTLRDLDSKRILNGSPSVKC